MRIQIAGVHKYQILTSVAIKINSKWPTNCAGTFPPMLDGEDPVPFAIRPHPAQNPVPVPVAVSVSVPWLTQSLFVYLHFLLRNGSSHLSQNWAERQQQEGRPWRWLINSGAYVCPQWEEELFILWLPCASFHSTGAQCWQHLTIFFQCIKGCFYFNVRFSHLITFAGQCSQNCLTGFSYRKKYIKKYILNITATCLRCDDINPVDETIKKSSQKSQKKMREYAKCRFINAYVDNKNGKLYRKFVFIWNWNMFNSCMSLCKQIIALLILANFA